MKLLGKWYLNNIAIFNLKTKTTYYKYILVDMLFSYIFWCRLSFEVQNYSAEIITNNRYAPHCLSARDLSVTIFTLLIIHQNIFYVINIYVINIYIFFSLKKREKWRQFFKNIFVFLYLLNKPSWLNYLFLSGTMSKNFLSRHVSM